MSWYTDIRNALCAVKLRLSTLEAGGGGGPTLIAGDGIEIDGDTDVISVAIDVARKGLPLAQFAAGTTSAELLALITNPTGTGAAVFGTGPALSAPVLTGGTIDSVDIGFRSVPTNSKSAAYTTVLADAGKCIDHPVSDNNARAFTIDGSVAYPVGTCISFCNMAATACTIPITTDTMYLAGVGSTGTRTLAQFGVATARKVAAGFWLISGTGLT